MDGAVGGKWPADGNGAWMPPTLHYSGPPIWAKAMASAAGEKPPASPGETVRNETLGERDFDGVRASGLRRTVSASEPQGSAVQSSTEIWWSSDLNEIVTIHSSVGYGTELRQIVRHEPDAALFYPPAGYRIQMLVTTP
jgi:hypothetical protein